MSVKLYTMYWYLYRTADTNYNLHLILHLQVTLKVNIAYCYSTSTCIQGKGFLHIYILNSVHTNTGKTVKL